VLTILFAYSSFPLRLSAGVGFVVSVLSSVIGAAYLLRGLLVGAAVGGWTSLVVLLAFFNGVTILLLSMLGEYVVRTLNQVSALEPYHVIQRVDARAYYREPDDRLRRFLGRPPGWERRDLAA
jgi:hypothetical protein